MRSRQRIGPNRRQGGDVREPNNSGAAEVRCCFCRWVFPLINDDAEFHADPESGDDLSTSIVRNEFRHLGRMQGMADRDSAFLRCGTDTAERDRAKPQCGGLFERIAPELLRSIGFASTAAGCMACEKSRKGHPEHAAALILSPGSIDKSLDETGRRSEESY